jgi:hypothetical protein
MCLALENGGGGSTAPRCVPLTARAGGGRARLDGPADCRGGVLRAGGVGSYVGHWCYVCEDTEPFTESLDRRMRRLIQRSNKWGGLRRQLVALQAALTGPGAEQGGDALKAEWLAVDVQARPFHTKECCRRHASQSGHGPRGAVGMP